MGQKAAHTPAPWLIEWNAAQGGEGHYITDSNDMGELSRIAAVLFHDDADGETRANARLIAAAPELLAALETAYMALIGYLPAHRNDVTDAAIGAASAAITKATGEAA